jgi:hypothetical protein
MAESGPELNIACTTGQNAPVTSPVFANFLSRVVNAMMGIAPGPGRVRVARFLVLHGGKFTDETDRLMSHQIR